MNGRRARALRTEARQEAAAGFDKKTKALHRDQGIERCRGVHHRVYQEKKRTWSRRYHHVVGTFTGARDRPSPRGGREHWEKVRSDYLRRQG